LIESAQRPDLADGQQTGARKSQALHRGDGRGFLLDDRRLIDPGATPGGREVVLNELMKPLFARFSDIHTCEAHRMIAEGDYVVVEARGKVTTKSGKAYNNSYCYVCRLLNGKLVEITEYMDTEMAAAVLGPP
jgi:uncharacterized protein